jgi:cytochrome c-type biogenesis protein CcmE
VIALSVASALAIFVVYTAVAGNGVANLRPSTVAGHTGTVSLVGKVVGKAHGNPYQRGGMRFLLKDVQSRDATRVPVMYRGSVPDQFKSGVDLVVVGALRSGVFVAKPGSMITKCPDHYAPAKSSKT